MGEPSANAYYGQDTAAMLKYLDYLTPMIYRCTYNKDRAWMVDVMKAFQKQAPSQIIAGVCSYVSDTNPTKYANDTLKGDIQAVLDVGSNGFAIFVEHLSNFTGLTPTPSPILKCPDNNLEYGCEGNNVKNYYCQEWINKYGFGKLVVDGKYYDKTKEAVTKY